MKYWIVLIYLLFALTALANEVSAENENKVRKALPEKATVETDTPRQLLIFTRTEGFVHSSIPLAARALQLLGEKTGAYKGVISDDMSMFDTDNLEKFDAICFLSTTRLEFADYQLRRNLMDYVKGGKGVIGIHAASDNFYSWIEGAKMIGGLFDGHPWGADGTWAIKLEDADHPVTAAFEGKGFMIRDEIYRIKPLDLRKNARVLLSLDIKHPANRIDKIKDQIRFTDVDLPVSWVRNLDKGRVFYSSLGHNEEVYWNSAVLKHYLDGIQFALGDLPATTVPVPFDAASNLDFGALAPLLNTVASYEYGKSLQPMQNINDFVRMAATSPQLLKRIEAQFVAFLKSDATLAGKQYICERLSMFGGKESVNILSKMLRKQETSDMARYALQRINHKDAAKALRKGLKKTKGDMRAGIIASLGERADREAVSDIAKNLDNENEKIASAAVTALGQIATTEAWHKLKGHMSAVSGDERQAVMNAMLLGADRAIAAGNVDLANNIFQELAGTSVPADIRAAAFRRKVEMSSDQAHQLIADALEAGDADLISAAIPMVREIPATTKIDNLISGFDSWSTASQVQFLTALNEREDRSVVTLGQRAVQSSDAAVRMAALDLLGHTGGAGVVKLLANAAANTKGPEREAARTNLYRLSDTKVDDEIRGQVPLAGAPVQSELIRAIGERRVANATELLFAGAAASDKKVRQESIKALRAVGATADVARMLELLAVSTRENERREWTRTISAVANQTEDKTVAGAPMLAQLESTTDPGIVGALYGILGRIGDPNALPMLSDALTKAAPDLQTAAIRALSEWPNNQSLEALRKKAQTATDQVQKVLALRGFIRSIGQKNDRTPEATVSLYKEAMTLAENNAEKKSILGGLRRVAHIEALESASPYLEVADLQVEAEGVILDVSNSMWEKHPDTCRTALEKVVAGTSNGWHRDYAGILLKRIAGE